jgi:hypothetical protein
VICNQAKELFQPLADGQLMERERKDLEGHLATCESCRTETARTKANVDFLRDHLSSLRDLVKVDPEALTKAARASAPPVAAPPPRKDDAPKRGVALAVAYLLLVVAAGTAVWAFVLRPRWAAESRQAATVPTPVPPGSTAATPPTPGPGAQPPPPGPRPGPKDPRPVPTVAGPAQMLSALLARPGQPALTSLWAALAKAPDQVENILTLTGAERDESRRALLVLALAGSNGQPRVRETLLSLLGSDGSVKVRGAAAAGLASAPEGAAVAVPGFAGLTVRVSPIEDVEVRGRLLSAAEGEREPSVVALLVRLLASSRRLDPAVDARLTQLLESEDEEVRTAALEASRLHPPKDPEAILALIRDDRIPENDRAALIQRLFEADEEGAVDRVAELAAGSTSEALTTAALGALATPKRAPGRGVETAASLLRGNATAGVKGAALQVLAAAGRRDASVLPLLEEIASGDPDEAIRERARSLADTLSTAPVPEDPPDQPGVEQPVDRD